jgi:hypothetical protein
VALNKAVLGNVLARSRRGGGRFNHASSCVQQQRARELVFELAPLRDPEETSVVEWDCALQSLQERDVRPVRHGVVRARDEVRDRVRD